jgi:hypothetical protein
MAEEMKRGLESYGHPVMRVRIDPQTLPSRETSLQSIRAPAT